MRTAVVTILVLLATAGRLAASSTVTHPILFVTQAPFGSDFTTVNSTFGNHQGNTGAGPRGGDLWIRYPDGTLRNLTLAAGYGVTAGHEISVREPSVHWSGTKALFSMVIGGTTQNDYTPVYWQIYEITGFGQGETVQITHLSQPANTNNVSPIYGTDDRIVFTSDRPRTGDRTLYPQLDEYESAPTNTGIWSMNADGSDLKLLDHAVSGDFTPIVASDGRLIFTRWDHLQRDQQNDEGRLGYGAFNFPSESSAQQLPQSEIFPGLRTVPAGSYVHGHTFNQFFPWQMNEDGSGLETVNHVGRHELAGYFDSSHDGLPEFLNTTGRPYSDSFLQMKEDPTRPGYYFATRAPEFGTHACGQIIGLNAPESLNADDMQLEYLTADETSRFYDPNQTPPPNHPGHFRNPTPLTDGTMIAVHTASPFFDRAISGPLSSRYDFKLVCMQRSGSTWTNTGRLIPGGISKTIAYWDNYGYQPINYSGPMWELDPVEVVARTRPARHANPLPAIERQILEEELGGPAGVDRLRAFLESRGLALIVSRNVTRRADRQQDFNLKITGSSTQTALPGATPIEVEYMQFVQGDLVRGYSSFHGGRRPIAQIMHDGLDPDLGPTSPAGSVRLGDDGSMAAFVPARRALSWQMTQDDGTPVVRERYWLTFAPGEMRTCGNCHGINRTDTVLHQPPPTNPPQALRDLARWWRDTQMQSNFVASLDGSQVEPSPTASAATGNATFTLRADSTLAYSLTTAGLTGTSATLRLGGWGSDGVAIATLAGGTSAWSGTTAALTPSQVDAIRANGVYVDVRTAANPNGEIRGQVVDPAVLAARRGNVGTAGGAPAVDVLRIGGSVGHPAYRSLVRAAGPVTFDLSRAPGANGVYALWVIDGESTAATLTPAVVPYGGGNVESLGMAVVCLPGNNAVTPNECACGGTFPSGFTSRPIFGPAGAARTCLHVAPPDALAPTSLVVNLPPGTWTIVGEVFDPNAPTTGPRKVSLTNAVTVIAR
ncbi:MAG: CHRD domain-containing protein [Planctomycetes bacterium]|nr:CHRD domain-containing protein [Planctomycetota bacterium]